MLDCFVTKVTYGEFIQFIIYLKYLAQSLYPS